MPLTNPASASAIANATNPISSGNGATTNLALTANTAASIAANPNRKYMLIVNTGTATVRMAIDATASATVGIPIEPGGNYEINSTNLFLGAISLFSASAGSVALLQG